jgi:hypothetical protein
VELIFNCFDMYAWIVVYLTDPLLLSVPSTFLTGSGLTRV